MTRCSLVIGLAVALPCSARAEETAPVEEKIQVGKDGKGVRAALERFRKGGSGTKGTQLQPSVKKKTQITGRLIRGGQGDVFIERTVDARTAELLVRMGFRAIQSEKELAHKTIIGNKVYILYDLDPKAFVPSSASQLEGEAVSLEVIHDAKGTPVVTSLKKGAR